jgi:protein-S-isoprenylcysteine O-methyltransferase Ste14
VKDNVSNIINRFGLVGVIIAVILLAALGSLLSPSPFVIGLQLLALATAGWARRSFPVGAFRVAADPAADGIIRSGPYRWIRHPMYSAALLFIWSGVMTNATIWTLLVRIAVTAMAAVRIIQEERLLRARYPGYASYADTTKAILPHVL